MDRRNKRRRKRIVTSIINLFLICFIFIGVLIIIGNQNALAQSQARIWEKINDLSTKNTQVDSLYQNEEKTVSRGNEERTDTYIGDFDITYYCPCEKCCGKTDGITYSGTQATEGRTIGTDLSVLPIGTKVYIEGIGERIVEDTGGGIQGNHIDVFVNSHEEALKLGRTTRKVYTVE